MPLYEYQCESCKHRFERIQKYSDPPPDTCPACGGAVKKLLSSPAIQFKGSGFYITDYAKKPSGGDAKPASSTGDAPSSSSSSEGSGSTGSKESKDSASGSTTKKEKE
jgi:putative FmdB family regulatory protein